MTPAQALVADVLEQHYAIGFSRCRCGWVVATEIGRSWRPAHQEHQAEMIAAAPTLVVRAR